MWPHSVRDYNWYNTKTFHKERGDTMVFISQRIRNFFTKHYPYDFSIDGAKITQLAQECMKKKFVVVKYK